MYVIKKGTLYLSKPGSKYTYADRIEHAQKFQSKEDAERNKCDNEHIAYVLDEID